MCNLIGYNGTSKPNIDKIKLLLALGRERGTHSCGIAFNNTVQYGVKQLKDSIDWVQELELPTGKLKTNTVIAHNRYATGGAWTEENAHPFVYCNDDGEIDFVFAHNGVISNISELAEKYAVNEKDFDVDSALLGYIIWKYGTDVLKEYVGAAALLFYWAENPDKLYVWKGASIESKWDTDKKKFTDEAVEERPLHFVSIGQGIYISSLFEHVNCIANKQKQIYTFSSNYLYEIENGEITNRTYFDRSTIRKPEKKKHTYYYNSYNTGIARNKSDDVVTEPCPQNIAKGRVYFWKGQYWHNGHLMHGIYNINPEDRISLDKKYPEFYFYKGYWVKDLGRYNSLLEIKQSYIYQVDIHPDSMARQQNSKMFILGKNIPTDDNPIKVFQRFFYYEYTLSFTYTLLSVKQKCYNANVEKFNILFCTDCSSTEECEEVYKQWHTEGFDWENINSWHEDYMEAINQ